MKDWSEPVAAGPFDVCVIGAGPAGMAAATEARRHGFTVALLDEAAAPGGQIWRGVGAAPEGRLRILGRDFAKGAGHVRAFAASGADYRASASVWHIEKEDEGFVLSVSGEGGSHTLRADRLIVATGALERPMPLPGWTLPGVTTVGAMQILLKSSGIVAEDGVLIGCGPLLYLVAAQMIEAGLPPRAIVETAPPRLGPMLRHLPAALGSLPYLVKGMRLLGRIRAAGVPIYRNARGIRLEGTGRLEAVSFQAAGRERRIETTSAGLHHGVVPNQQITRLMRCDHVWDAGQHGFRPVLDDWGQSSCEGLYVAGDGAGIGGAAAAVLAGRLVAMGIARAQGRDVPEAAELRAALRRDLRVRPLLEALYPPFSEALQPADETMVCRCEEITAGQIRAAVAQNAPGPNQIKSFLRTGMGPCQGRVCGLAVTELIAAGHGISPDEAGYFRIRPPLKPLTIAELAEAEPAGPR